MKLLYAVVAIAIVAFLSLDLHAPVEARNQPDRFENYDIREHSSENARRPRISDSRLKIEYNDVLDVAEVIAPTEGMLASTARSRADALRDYVLDNRQLFGVADRTQLKLTADYTNPDGNLSFARFEQTLNGVPVFGAEVKAGFTRRNEMFRVINSLAHNLNAQSVAKDFGEASTAVIAAAQQIGVETNSSDLELKSGNVDQARFETPDLSDTAVADKFYFPVGNSVAVPSWRVLLWTNTGGAYYVVVDSNGTLLWRKNLVEVQAAPSTYSVFRNGTSPLRTSDSPSPFTPGCIMPVGCAQPPPSPYSLISLVGNEAPYTFNNLGWIPDDGLPVRTPANANITDGNNVEAGIDRIAPTGVDDNGWAFGNPTRVFNYAYNPAPGDPPPGEEPLPGMQTYPPSAFQQGVITNGFYLINRWHDEMYRFGFNEVAGNFQHFNFGRGGAEGDRISFEMQDGSGTNGANLAVAADGNRPRLQMFIWTGPTPDRDGALDSQMVVHEITHGVSNRLIGNATGLGSNMARGMGEGWSDFYAFALLSEPSDNPLGTHALAGYASYLITPTYVSNYYYGLRRFPVAAWASRGSNGLPHNPLTFKYINSGCDTFIGTTVSNPNSAYPRNPVISTSGASQPCDQIHNLGEVWSVTLWEVRDQLIQRRGPTEGNRRVLQYVTDGMKLSPLNPTVIQERDAIIAAASATDANDVAPMWRGFAIRGLGANASIQNAGTGSNNTAVTESFALPPQFRRPAHADFDGDARTDVSVFRPSDRVWYLNRSTSGFSAITWGLATDKPIPDDYDGDAKADIAVFRATDDGSMPDYYILRSTDSTVMYISWGTTGDIAVTDDYDGDNKADPTIYRPSSGQFWVRRSTDGFASLGGPLSGSPLAIDYDGDGRADYATFNNGTWRIIGNGAGSGFSIVAGFGAAGDKPVPADYDGDGRDDLAVYRPSDGTWYIFGSSSGLRSMRWGISTDVPATGDYDGDGRADIAVYRDGVWYLNQSTSGVLITNFGLAGDAALPASYFP